MVNFIYITIGDATIAGTFVPFNHISFLVHFPIDSASTSSVANVLKARAFKFARAAIGGVGYSTLVISVLGEVVTGEMAVGICQSKQGK